MRLLIILSLMFASGLHAGEITKATIVKYQIFESGVAPYVSRMIITDNIVRMDDDEDNGNYLLFSRATGVIESVNHDDSLIIVINPRENRAAPPFPLRQKIDRIALSEVPMIAGKVPQQFQLSVNGEPCQSVVSVDGLLNDVVKSWRKFRYVLAGEHAATLSYIPTDQQVGCDLVLNTFYPAWFLDFGLPIQAMEVGGRGMQLIDYVKEGMVDLKLFELPEEYQRYTSE